MCVALSLTCVPYGQMTNPCKYTFSQERIADDVMQPKQSNADDVMQLEQRIAADVTLPEERIGDDVDGDGRTVNGLVVEVGRR